jgi:isopenicillin N synthase-like dioxygenase
MAYATAREIELSEIPVIDLAGLSTGAPEAIAEVAAALTEAAERVGFFYVSNHGIPQAQIEAMFEMSHRFFAHAPEDKRKLAVNDYHHGFIEIGEAQMYEGANVDLKESFVWGLDVEADDPDTLAGNRLIGPNRWPGFMPELRPALVDYMAACNALGARLLEAFAVSIGVARDTFIRRFDRPISRGSLVYYPPQDASLGRAQFGVAPHTDYGCLTFVYQDEIGGLQVIGADGQWLTAHPIPGTFVVNVGDLLARWTNDRFKSTLHRVVNSSGRERYSMAMFVDPNYDAPIEPVVRPGETAKYETVECGAYILSRYDTSFAYRRK